jgi:hypothetical protein
MNSGFVSSNETGSPVTAPSGGRRGLRKVSAKTVRRVLRSAGVKPKGRVVLKGGEEPSEEASKLAPAMGGRRRRGSRKTRRKRGLFGLRR